MLDESLLIDMGLVNGDRLRAALVDAEGAATVDPLLFDTIACERGLPQPFERAGVPDLTSASLLYRRPELYDELAGEGVPTAHLLAILERHHGRVRSLLDVGYGTGRHLAGLASAITGLVGVDLLPGMVAYARAVHPCLDIRQADMTRMEQARAVPGSPSRAGGAGECGVRDGRRVGGHAAALAVR